MIRFIDRVSRKEEAEKVYGQVFIQILYGDGWFYKLLSFFILPLIARVSFFSKLYGTYQKSPISRSKVKRFIEAFQIDTSEFLEPVDSFRSFNDFFIRKLKPSVRPMATGDDVAVLPADARYLVYQHIERAEGFLIKGEKFHLEELLKDETKAHLYKQGSMVIARLCPVDYHRYHFPCDNVPGTPKLINGPLFSVNPMAIKQNIHILSENKRVITELETKHFGRILYIEVGATYVGSINQTFTPGKHYAKGDEKGFFAFGGSCLVILFEPFRIQLDQDLVEASLKGIEVRGLLGQSLGHKLG